MPKQSANGSDSATGEGPTPYERFERLTREILGVPKSEVDKRRQTAKRPRSTSRARS